MYIEDWSNPSQGGFGQYPTMLLYGNDFISPNWTARQSEGFRTFDASGYRMYALYDNVLPVL